MNEEIKSLKFEAEKAKVLLYTGTIGIEEAKTIIEPYISAVNAKSRELAKKYNQKPRLVSISGFLR